ncbi:MAG: ATP phosphoribosyltransferase regulatory subunit [Rhizobiaceae bacterium]
MTGSDRLLSFFAGRGCEMPAISLLQPADPFLDTAGEDLRRRIFITADQSGATLCLRPEFTIPVCLLHLERANGPARYGYTGTVFRQRRDEPNEFRQAGIEDLGNPDRVEADIASLSDCLSALQELGVGNPRLTLGDQSIFEAVLKGLDLPSAWQKRLSRAFGDRALLSADVARLSGEGQVESSSLAPEVAAMLGKHNRKGLESWIAARIAVSGLSGGRTAAEIATRLMEKAELAAVRLDEAHRLALEAFLGLECLATDAPARLGTLAKEHGLAISDSVSAFASRISRLKEAGSLPSDARYRASFGRRLDYYTGLVFEVSDEGAGKPLAGGGRYDRLMTLLGAGQEVPAVGFSIWLDRVAQSVAKTRPGSKAEDSA